MGDRWIKIYDRILEWEWWSNALMVKAWVFILVSANSRQKRWQGMTIERGQFVTSQSKMARELDCNRKTVRKILDRLISAGQITATVDNSKTIITVCNYDNYQENNSRYGQQDGQLDGQQSGQLDGQQSGHNIRYKNNNNIVVDTAPAGARAREDFEEVVLTDKKADRPTGLGFCARARITADKVADWLRENGGQQWKEVACMQLGLSPQQLDVAFDEFQRELIAQGVEDKEEQDIRIHFMSLIRKKIEWNKKQNRYGNNDQRINSLDDIRECVEVAKRMANTSH